MGYSVKLTHRHSFTINPLPPYNFELTVHKPAGWPLFTPYEVYENDTLWTALHLDGLLTGVKLTSKGSTDHPEVLAEVFLRRAPSARQKAQIKRLLVSKLGADVDLSDFYDLARKDPVLRHTVSDLHGLHRTGFSSLFAAATLAISLQMAPIKRSNEMQGCLIERYGEVALFDGREIPVWPTAGSIVGLKAQELALSCKWGYRARFLVELARALQDQHSPTLEGLARLSPDEAKKKLLGLPGIGDYSADIINPHGGFSIDVWSADIFGKLFFGAEAETGRTEIERIKAEGVRRWGNWASLAFLYVVHDLPNLSRQLRMSLRLS